MITNLLNRLFNFLLFPIAILWARHEYEVLSRAGKCTGIEGKEEDRIIMQGNIR